MIFITLHSLTLQSLKSFVDIHVRHSEGFRYSFDYVNTADSENVIANKSQTFLLDHGRN